MESARKISHANFSRQQKFAFLLALTFAAIFITVCLPPISQAQLYHTFVDNRKIFGIENFLNVISNFGFLLGGFWGMKTLANNASQSLLPPPEKYPWLVFFVGAMLTAFGSAYYHFAPTNARLVWDRLPMTIVFMSFLSAMIAERIGSKIGARLLLPLLGCGCASVLYWHFSELAGCGDLRFYGFVQFFPVLLIPVILWLFPPRHSHTYYVGAMLVLYAVAKVFEAYDEAIFADGNFISGHTIKHLIAALPIFLMARMLMIRRPVLPHASLKNS